MRETNELRVAVNWWLLNDVYVEVHYFILLKKKKSRLFIITIKQRA